MSDMDLDEMVKVAEQQAATAVSYVEVELPDMPPIPQDPPDREFDVAVTSVLDSLRAVRLRLSLLREERATINSEIKALVSEEELLNRMSKVALAKKE